MHLNSDRRILQLVALAALYLAHTSCISGVEDTAATASPVSLTFLSPDPSAVDADGLVDVEVELTEVFAEFGVLGPTWVSEVTEIELLVDGVVVTSAPLPEFNASDDPGTQTMTRTVTFRDVDLGAARGRCWPAQLTARARATSDEDAGDGVLSTQPIDIVVDPVSGYGVDFAGRVDQFDITYEAGRLVRLSGLWDVSEYCDDTTAERCEVPEENAVAFLNHVAPLLDRSLGDAPDTWDDTDGAAFTQKLFLKGIESFRLDGGVCDGADCAHRVTFGMQEAGLEVLDVSLSVQIYDGAVQVLTAHGLAESMCLNQPVEMRDAGEIQTAVGLAWEEVQALIVDYDEEMRDGTSAPQARLRGEPRVVIKRACDEDAYGTCVPSSVTDRRAVWQVPLYGGPMAGLDTDGVAGPYEMFIDAGTGALVDIVQRATHTIKDIEIYDADGDTSEDIGCGLLYGDVCDSYWGGCESGVTADAQLAYDLSADTYDLHKDTWGWDSYDRDGAQLESFVRVDWARDPKPTGSYSPFCDNFRFQSGEVNPSVFGHELRHAIDQYRATPLRYSGMPGALNEHFADIFGVWLAWKQTGQFTWDIAGRNLADPGSVTILPGVPMPIHMDDYVPADRGFGVDGDHGEVHTNSAVMNYVTPLLADGGVHPDSQVSVAGIGRDKAFMISHSAHMCMSHTAAFSEYRREMISSAERWIRKGVETEGEPWDSGDVCAIRNAFAAVGIGAPDFDCDGVEDVGSDRDYDDDTIADDLDNCRGTPNRHQHDQDGDGEGDACDEDLDNDGIDNIDDNCPAHRNTAQDDQDLDGRGDVCDDSDGDGIGDDNDNCPNFKNMDQRDIDGDDLGDLCDDDIDGDGVPNDSDNCYAVSNPQQENQDGDAFGDHCEDSDGDGIFDIDDACPDVWDARQTRSGLVNQDTDDDGLPDCLDDDDDDDGLPDIDDDCPTIPNHDPADLDGDGVPSACDNCPYVANTGQADNDHDTRGDACDRDDDNDGVVDEDDNCPWDQNPGQADRDGDGDGDACDDAPYGPWVEDVHREMWWINPASADAMLLWDLPSRRPLPMCGATCPETLGVGYRMEIAATMEVPFALAIVNHRGDVVRKSSEIDLVENTDGTFTQQLSFAPLAGARFTLPTEAASWDGWENGERVMASTSYWLVPVVDPGAVGAEGLAASLSYAWSE